MLIPTRVGAAPGTSGVAPKLHAQSYRKLYEGQHGLCACCARAEVFTDPHGAVLPLALYYVKRDRVTKGLVCRRCKLGLEMFGDDASLVARAAAFLAAPPVDVIDVEAHVSLE